MRSFYDDRLMLFVRIPILILFVAGLGFGAHVLEVLSNARKLPIGPALVTILYSRCSACKSDSQALQFMPSPARRGERIEAHRGTGNVVCLEPSLISLDGSRPGFVGFCGNRRRGRSCGDRR